MSNRILHLSKLYPPFWGGIETVVYDLVKGSIRAKNKVDVLCVSENNESSTEVFDGATVYRCASFLHVASLYLSWDFIKRWYKIRNNYDIIHVHFPNPLALCALFFLSTNSKIVVHWHSDIVKQKFLKIPFIPIQKWVLKRCSRIITTSPIYAQSSTDLQPYLDKVEVIPIGINVERYDFIDSSRLTQLKEKYADKKIIFSLGRHVYYKGFEYLIESALNLPDDYIILLGGVGELTGSYQNLINKYSLNDKVILLGKIPSSDISAYFSICDVFCLPSVERSEAYGVVQLEAMCFGKPVISTDIYGSGVPWVNKNNVSGLVVPTKNSESLAHAIIEVIEGNEFNSDGIKSYFDNNFTVDIMNKKTIEMYKKVFE
ncbi:glycosyltransferase [Vibrio chemaguriensis]|uniref:glycosyltransferase n=1 Tax=Vibrio chemaguriensis TaxID=2527672 RepID=UPI001CDC0B20|nr:glycosyltransferase [Vibrio chemaguriensis]MCA2415567.1 glycosyltransferase [Vibrio chemaguriensis]MCA2426654.1 glycosyltransferase [Vibrio chemaguriensis]